jgi:ribosomal protein L39E
MCCRGQQNHTINCHIGIHQNLISITKIPMWQSLKTEESIAVNNHKFTMWRLDKGKDAVEKQRKRR